VAPDRSCYSDTQMIGSCYPMRTLSSHSMSDSALRQLDGSSSAVHDIVLSYPVAASGLSCLT
jgi:hypothetical protein